jgi:hypothetical protein
MQKLDRKNKIFPHNGLAPPPALALRPQRRPDIRTRLVDGETIVLDRREEFVHQLNKTASYIWERCDGRYSPAEIADEVCAAFEVDHLTALRDVLDIVKELERRKLLQSA